MTVPSCALSIMVARTDIPFMMHTIPHLVRACAFPFVERTLIVDTAPLTGDKVNRPGIGSFEQLRNNCNQLLEAGIIDRIVDMDYSDAYRATMYQKHLGNRFIRPTHNYKGYPILGTIFSLEEVSGDYVLHFDSDMMLHQEPGYSWIEEAIKLLDANPEIIFIRPMAGPPAGVGHAHQNHGTLDSEAYMSFKMFGSRVYLLKRDRFEQILPLPVMWRPFKTSFINTLPTTAKTLINQWTGQGKLDSWEKMVTAALKTRKERIRANMTNPKAWTVHPKDRGDRFINALPQIVQKVEAGEFPPEQVGFYDMVLEPWLRELKPESISEEASSLSS